MSFKDSKYGSFETRVLVFVGSLLCWLVEWWVGLLVCACVCVYVCVLCFVHNCISYGSLKYISYFKRG